MGLEPIGTCNVPRVEEECVYWCTGTFLRGATSLFKRGNAGVNVDAQLHMYGHTGFQTFHG